MFVRDHADFLRVIDSLHHAIWLLQTQETYRVGVHKKLLHQRLLEIIQFAPRDSVRRLQKSRVERLLNNLPSDIAFLKEKFPQYVAPIATLQSMLSYATERKHMLESSPDLRKRTGYYADPFKTY